MWETLKKKNFFFFRIFWVNTYSDDAKNFYFIFFIFLSNHRVISHVENKKISCQLHLSREFYKKRCPKKDYVGNMSIIIIRKSDRANKNKKIFKTSRSWRYQPSQQSRLKKNFYYLKFKKIKDRNQNKWKQISNVRKLINKKIWYKKEGS